VPLPLLLAILTFFRKPMLAILSLFG